MKFEVVLSRQARRCLQRCDSETQRRLAELIDTIADDPYSSPTSKPLAGPGGFRSARMGNLRVIFVVDRGRVLVLVQRIAPRGQVYRDL